MCPTVRCRSGCKSQRCRVGGAVSDSEPTSRVPPQRSSSWSSQDRDRERVLLAEFAGLDVSDPRRSSATNWSRCMCRWCTTWHADSATVASRTMIWCRSGRSGLIKGRRPFRP